MSSRDNDKAPQRRLRVPAALAVAFVGSSAMVSTWYGGCDPHTPDPVPDGGHIESRADADVPADAGMLIDDASSDADAGTPDTPPADPPPDASEPPH